MTYFENGKPCKQEIDSWTLDAELCEFMGWYNVDSPDGVSLRGNSPVNGRHQYVRPYSVDANANTMLRTSILHSMKYRDGGKIVMQATVDSSMARVVFFRQGTDEQDAFEGKAWCLETAAAIAAYKLFKKLGPLPGLMYANKKQDKLYKERIKALAERTEAALLAPEPKVP